MNYLITDNTSGAVRLRDIPETDYASFYDDLRARLSDSRWHVGHYFALPEEEARLRFYLLLLDDATGQVLIGSFAREYYDGTALPSLQWRGFCLPTSRFSSTVSSVKMRRSSGT